MKTLPERLRIMANMINMGERISWGSDSAIMDEAAYEIERLQAELAQCKFDAECYREGGIASLQKLAQYKSALSKPDVWMSWNDKDGYGYWPTRDEAELACAEDFDPTPLYELPGGVA